MKMSSFSVVLGMMSLLSVCSGHIGGGPPMMQDLNPQVYCGRNLAMALAELCNYQPFEKRGDPGTPAMYNVLFSPYYKEQENRAEQYGWPWLSHHKAHALGLPSRGKRFTGVVDECCTKACNIDEMLTYCN